MGNRINFYWFLGCIMALIVILIASFQLFPVNYSRLSIQDKELVDLSINHLNNIADKVHNVGSIEKQNAKEYIISVIEKNGYIAKIQKGNSIYSYSNNNENLKINFAEVENIYTEVEGILKNNKILIISHYDTVPYSFGAADDSTAVSAALANFELFCDMIKQGKKPLNSIVFLFTDGEEIGLLGANYFVQNYEDMNKISAIINLEARGNRGKSILFQSKDNSNQIIRQYNKFDKKLLGFSFSNAIYEKMPNRTDFSIFESRKINGLNFAFIQNSIVYHSFLDNIKNLSIGSIVETNLKVKNFINAFSDYDFNEKVDKEPILLYFTVFGKLIYFTRTSYLLLLISIIISISGIFIYRIFNKLLIFKKFLISLTQIVILFIVFPISLLIVNKLIHLIFPVLNLFSVNPFNELIYFVVIYSLSFLIMHLLVTKFSKFIDYNTIFLASSLFFLILLLFVYNISIDFSAIFAAFAVSFIIIELKNIIILKLLNSHEEKINYIFHFLLMIFAIIIGIPFSYLTYISLGLKNLMFSFIGLFPIIIFFAGNYGKISNYDKRIVFSFLLIVVITFIIIISFNLQFNKDKPLLSSISIIKDNDTSEISIILPYNEVKYSNNLWHKSILSLGKSSIEGNIYKISEITEINFPKTEFIKIISSKFTKKYKEYELEINSNFWTLTLPPNSQMVIKDSISLSFDKTTTFKGFSSYEKIYQIKIRIPLNEILLYSAGNYFIYDKFDINLPKRPAEILGIYDNILIKGKLK